MPVSKDNVDDVFRYHQPDENQIATMQTLREKAKDIAIFLLDESKFRPCADVQAALRLLREAVMTANAAVVLKGKV